MRALNMKTKKSEIFPLDFFLLDLFSFGGISRPVDTSDVPLTFLFGYFHRIWSEYLFFIIKLSISCKSWSFVIASWISSAVIALILFLACLCALPSSLPFFFFFFFFFFLLFLQWFIWALWFHLCFCRSWWQQHEICCCILYVLSKECFWLVPLCFPPFVLVSEVDEIQSFSFESQFLCKSEYFVFMFIKRFRQPSARFWSNILSLSSHSAHVCSFWSCSGSSSLPSFHCTSARRWH